MPDMDGRDLLSKIRETDIRIPIVISTAYSSYKQDSRCGGRCVRGQVP